MLVKGIRPGYRPPPGVLGKRESMPNQRLAFQWAFLAVLLVPISSSFATCVILGKITCRSSDPAEAVYSAMTQSCSPPGGPVREGTVYRISGPTPASFLQSEEFCWQIRVNSEGMTLVIRDHRRLPTPNRIQTLVLPGYWCERSGNPSVGCGSERRSRDHDDLDSHLGEHNPHQQRR